MAFGVQLVDTAAEIGSLSIHDHSNGVGIVALGGAPIIHHITLTKSLPDVVAGDAAIWEASSTIVQDSELGDLWIDDLSPATITENVILTIGVNEDNSQSTGGEAIIRKNDLGYVSLAGPVTVEDNEFPESMASDDETIGIFVQNGGGWSIRNNVIRGRQTGIQALPDGVIEGNTIEGNGVGLCHVGDPPTMSGNRICDNTFSNVRAERSKAEIDLTTNEICPDE